MRTEVSVQELFQESATQKHPLGTTFEWLNKKFVYSKANKALSAHQILTPAATPIFTEDVVHTNTAAEDSIYGKMAIAQVVNVDTAPAAVAAGALAGAILFVDQGLGAGQAEWVIGNTAMESGGKGKIYLRAALGTALTTAGNSDITLYSPDLVEKAAVTNKKQVVLGVTPIDVTSGYYFWRQVSGLCLVKHGATTAAGAALIPGDDTEGQAVTAGADEDVGDVSPFGIALTDSPSNDTACLAFIRCP